MSSYYAHSAKDEPPSSWQNLREHLLNVARLAHERAQTAGPTNVQLVEAAVAAGLLHDLGKYRPEFQRYIEGNPPLGSKNHSQAGAAKAFVASHAPIAFAVAGHHIGLPDLQELKDLAKGPDGQPVMEGVWQHAVADCQQLGGLSIAPPKIDDAFSGDLFTRMLFSCLVDADWADTRRFEERTKGLHPDPEPAPFIPADWLQRVLAHINVRAENTRGTIIGRIREEILRACLKAADHPPGMYTLTVPTGGGKTLSALAFGLKHAAKHGLRRLIYVAPYLTILEQNADVIRAALGVDKNAAEVFEHHSLSDPPESSDGGKNSSGQADEDGRTAERAAKRAENWAAPVVVTTNVQFFESLFANRPARCRKLHNIPRSVILLDECQSIPPGLVAPTCGMIKQLAAEFGCTIILCTATQPALDHPKLDDRLTRSDNRLRATEIIPPDLDLFNRLKRVQLEWPKSADEKLDWSMVAQLMASETAALCVVNTRKKASQLFSELKNVARSRSSVFHLSTNMCPDHRRQVLTAAKTILGAGQLCYLVSTQLIEAGVDVDFPVVLREMAPLEGVIQAAGRCNREGKLNGADGSPGGKVIVFRSTDDGLPADGWYKLGRDKVESVFLADGRSPRIDEPEDIRQYYTHMFYAGDLDKHKIQPARNGQKFRIVAEHYKLITDDTVPVVVASWKVRADEIETLIAAVRAAPTSANFRKLIPFQVNLRRYELLKYQLVSEDPDIDLFVWRGGYDSDLGLTADNQAIFLV
jgi:CRISPR-associated endonuclease/helicase Cas3